MTKVFYDHLILIEDIIVSLDTHGVPVSEKRSLLTFIDETIHSYVLDTILTHLPKEHHEHFLFEFTRAPHQPSLLDFLKKKTKVDIEQEIKKTVEHVKKKVLKDLEDSLEEV